MKGEKRVKGLLEERNGKGGGVGERIKYATYERMMEGKNERKMERKQRKREREGRNKRKNGYKYPA